MHLCAEDWFNAERLLWVHKDSGSQTNLFRVSRGRWEEINNLRTRSSYGRSAFYPFKHAIPPPVQRIQGKDLFLTRFSRTVWLRSGLKTSFALASRAWLFLQKMASSPSCFCLAAAGRGIVSESCGSLHTQAFASSKRKSPTAMCLIQRRAVKTADSS